MAVEVERVSLCRFTHPTIARKYNCGSKRCQGQLGIAHGEPKSRRAAQKCRKWYRSLLLGKGKNHEKYSAEVSTAMRNSCETRCGGGGLSATKISLRWLRILSTTKWSVRKVIKERRSRERSGRIMYFPTRSASFLVLARTLLWTEKPVWRQPEIFSTRASETSSSPRRRAKTSREKNSANRLSSNSGR